MTFLLRARWARLSMAAGFSLTMMLSAAAETPPDETETELTEEAGPVAAGEADDADILKDIDVSKLDWSQLNIDPLTLPILPLRPGAAPRSADGGASWSSDQRANGTSAVSVRQSISPVWDAQVGADMTVARQGTLTNSEALSERLANGGSLPQSSGSAWATITAPGVASIWDRTSVEARVDPSSEQSRLGTSLSKSVPLGDDYSLTLQNGYDVIQQGIVPVPGIIGHPSRYETGHSARLGVTGTGTSFTAGQTLSSTDDRWLRRIGAEQRLFDGITVSGSVAETAQGTANASVTAGFKRSW